jgi:GT2 family glycosyltransferase
MENSDLKTVPGLVQIQVVNYRRADLTIACIESIKALKGGNRRLLVIDNASPDDSVAKLRAYDPGLAILVSPANVGWGGAQNQGRRYRGFGDLPEYILAVNSDAVLEPDSLEEMRKTMEAHPDCAVVAPLIYKDRSKRRIDNVGYNLSYRYFLPLDTARLFRDHSRHIGRGAREVSWSDDTVALMRAGMVEEAGGYDEGYFLYVDMTDLAYRLRLQGRKLWVCYRAVVYHSGKGSSGDGLSLFSLYHKFYGWWRFQNKYFSRLHLPYVVVWIGFMYAALGFKLYLTGRGRMHRELTMRFLKRAGGPRPG